MKQNILSEFSFELIWLYGMRCTKKYLFHIRQGHLQDSTKMLYAARS
jgi:hypothetical protein